MKKLEKIFKAIIKKISIVRLPIFDENEAKNKKGLEIKIKFLSEGGDLKMNDLIKDNVIGAAKSKTVGAAVFVALIILIARKFGVELSTEEATIIMATVMIILRFFTNGKLSDKIGDKENQ